MGRTDDEEQLEYIQQWWDMKQEEIEEKRRRRVLRRICLRLAKIYFGKAIKELGDYFKFLFGKEVR